MAEVHRESEASKMKKVSEGHEGKTGASNVAETSSFGKSEGKSESSSRLSRSGEISKTSASTLVPKKSESASTTVAKDPVPSKKGAVPKAPVQSQKTASKGASPSKKETVPKGTSPSKAKTSPKSTVSSIIGSIAKWASPPKKKTVKGSGSSAESDESPDKKEKSTTASSGKRIKDKIKNVGNILFGSKTSKPSKSEEMHLVQPEAESRHDDTSCLASKQTEPVSQQTDPETPWTPKYVEITGQENLYLRGELTASYETLHPTKTDTSSLSESVSLEVERASSLPLDCEGSFGDSSSLERDFEELSSPSKNIKGLKRIQTAIVEEEEDAMDSSNSPRKCRVVSQDADPVEKPSDIEMD